MLPDGEYVMSQSQVAKAIEADEIYIRRFLKSDALKAIQGNGFTFDSLPYQDSQIGRGKSGRIKVVTLDAVVAFWVSQSNKGNDLARALVCACAMETLQRRCDRIFRVRKTDSYIDYSLVTGHSSIASRASKVG